MSSKKQAQIPENLSKLLAAAEKASGLPAGTMQSILKQEVGSNPAYLEDPTKYHYPLNAMGKRIAGHTGKESTAFGPFGILDSTARQPGYGVKPMVDKSIEEQVRFSAEYLAARAKSAGSLSAGLAGYGEGSKYAAQVMARMPATQPVVMAQAPLQPPPLVAGAIPEITVGRSSVVPQPEAVAAVGPSQGTPGSGGDQGPIPLPPELVAYLESRSKVPAAPAAQNAWLSFLSSMGAPSRGGTAATSAAVQPEDIDYTQALARRAPSLDQEPVPRPGRVDFTPFSAFGRLGTRKIA